MLLSKPEMTYWRNKGLKLKQVNKWIKLINCDEKTMYHYLCYCAFDMLDLGLEESKPVNNVFNWFYKILEKTGSYPKPKDYKSFEEKQLDREQEELAKQKKIAKEREKIYLEKIETIFEARFWEMMNNSQSEEYKNCFSKINSVARNQWRKVGAKSQTFQANMRTEFKKLEQETKF